MCAWYTLAGVSLKKAGLASALTMVIALQASGNLVNSYVDYNYGVDTVQTAGDRCVCVCVRACVFGGGGGG